MNPDGILHHPTIFHLGPLEITGFGLAVLAAFAMAQFVCQREFVRRGQFAEADTMPDLTLASLVGTLVGGKIYLIALTGSTSQVFSRSGFVFLGGLIGGVLCCFLTIRWRKMSFARFADVTGLGIAAGYAIGRTGCWAVGDDYGKPWSGPFSVRFPEGAPPSTASVMSSQFGVVFPPTVAPSDVIAVHPTQLYETAMGFVMFLLLWRLRGHRHAAGWLFGAYCLLAGVERFIVEFFRAKDDRLAAGGGLSTAQFIAIAMVAIGATVLVLRRNPEPVAA